MHNLIRSNAHVGVIMCSVCVEQENSETIIGCRRETQQRIAVIFTTESLGWMMND